MTPFAVNHDQLQRGLDLLRALCCCSAATRYGVIVVFYITAPLWTEEKQAVVSSPAKFIRQLTVFA